VPELLRLFFGLPESEVLGLRDGALALIKEGKTLMSVSGGGKSGSKQFPISPREVLFEANAALRHLNPDKYGRRIRKTYANFRNRHE